ncbi:sensor histidine kinase [Roseivirga sp.]|uniref:ATP-binding protein n=1 Tax=Roseivirga sp. TaxID=1964215 RepID=UPI003B8AF3AD
MLRKITLYSWLTLLCFSVFGQDESFMDLANKGDAYRAESKYDSALIVYNQLADTARVLSNYEFQARAQVGMAAVYIQTEKNIFAIEAYDKAIALSKIWGNEYYENIATYGKGITFNLSEEYDSSLFYFQRAEKFFEKTEDYVIVGGIAANIAANFRLRGMREKSLIKDKEAVKYYELSNRSRELCNRFFYIGKDYLVLSNQDSLNKRADFLDSSFVYLNKSLAISDSLSYPEPKSWALKSLAQVSYKRGDIIEAYDLMHKASDITEDLYSRNYDDKIIEFATKYKTAELELRNDLQENQLLAKSRAQLLTLIVSASLIIIISIWLYVVDQRRKGIKALAEKNDQINKQKIDDLLQEQEIASLQGVLEGQETERKRVAIDLHDRLGGILSMVKLHFSAVEEKIDEENPNKKKFLTASELLDLAAGEVRNISHDMMSGVLAKFGLVPALKDLKTRISETGQLDFNLIVNLKNSTLSGEQELQLYRIVQELISNILKHSQATETNIQLNENEGSVNLIVEDDGVGFETKQLENANGIGLSNLKARVAKLEGTFHVDSGKGAGTTVSIDIPIEND